MPEGSRSRLARRLPRDRPAALPGSRTHEESMIRRDARDETDERRSHPRIPARLLPTLSAQLSGGSKVTLLDLSQHGVRLETTRHMRPGQMVSLRFCIDDQIV